MSSLVQHAENELAACGMTADSTDEMNLAMRNHLLHMVQEFANEGHSGFSASYAVSMLERLLRFQPLVPLTGEDSEWQLVYTDDNGVNQYQNKRHSAVFRDGEDNATAYNIEGRVFYRWATDEDGNKYKDSSFTNYNSRVPVVFPYTVPAEPEYVEVKD